MCQYNFCMCVSGFSLLGVLTNHHSRTYTFKYACSNIKTVCITIFAWNSLFQLSIVALLFRRYMFLYCDKTSTVNQLWLQTSMSYWQVNYIVLAKFLNLLLFRTWLTLGELFLYSVSFWGFFLNREWFSRNQKVLPKVQHRQHHITIHSRTFTKKLDKICIWRRIHHQ